MAVNEEVYYEGAPHIGDLIFNLLISIFVITIPFGIAAIARALWLRYRITNRRITVTGGWMGRSRTDVIYTEIVKVVKVARGLGIWGDMVVTLRDGSRLELKSLPRFRETFDYIESKISSPPQDIPNAVMQ
ncbi:MAG: PH domain-containing protein [Pseudanabaenaceae cyanobacterium bins.39]|nr:PH domain-containing protein [Pseudanabaenaceae cyanobacterium bins.39]